MILARQIASALLGAAAVAGVITYYFEPNEPKKVAPSTNEPLPAVAQIKLPSRDVVEQEMAAANYLQAARAILKKAPETQAALLPSDQPQITGHVPLPRKRPIALGDAIIQLVGLAEISQKFAGMALPESHAHLTRALPLGVRTKWFGPSFCRQQFRSALRY
jgi:hypothetical protein